MREIIRANDLGVLATCADHQPHSSLMAYVPHEDCRTIYMLTQRDSRKFRNISANPRVSLMVDTRLDSPESRPAIKALTISGTCSPSPQSMQKQFKHLLVQNHPQLETMAAQEDSIVMEITIESILLLDGIDNAYFVELSGQQKL